MDEESGNQRTLPVHGYPGGEDDRFRTLRVDGLVRNRLELTLADLELFPQQDVADDFTCLEGWTVPKVRWRGVLLKAVLSLAGPRVEAHYVQASAGNFGLPLLLERADRALLAVRLYENLVPREHGGPVRLIVPGGECFTSIKWLDHLELLAQPGSNTAQQIALSRLPATRFHKGASENDSRSVGGVLKKSSD